MEGNSSSGSGNQFLFTSVAKNNQDTDSNESADLKLQQAKSHGRVTQTAIVVLMLAVVAAALTAVAVILNNNIKTLGNRIEELEARVNDNNYSENASVGLHSSFTQLSSRVNKTLNDAVVARESSISELYNRVDELYASLEAANSSRYAGCYEERAFCTISGRNNAHYRGCRTGRISANISVS